MTTDLSTTQEFRNILCPIDFSKCSRQALQYAARLARRAGGRITALFVEDPLLAAAASGTGMPVTTRAQLRRFVERAVAPWDLSAGSLVFRMTEGKPYQEIARAADQLGCDLIVMGAHGITGPAKLALGSTTERVLRTTSIPVLAIPAIRGGAAFVSRKWPARLTLAPVELGSHLRADIESAAEIAAALGGPLMVVHVVSPRDRDTLVKAHGRLDRVMRSLNLESSASSRILAGKPEEQIAALAADADADLVVITRRRGPGLFGARLGSISYRILCLSGAPILALPPKRRQHARTRTSANAIRRAG